MDANGRNLNVVMFPFLAHGHISPFFEIAKRLARRSRIQIYFCSTPVNLNPIRKRVPRNLSHSIQLVDYHLPPSPDLPPNYHTTNGLPPHLKPTLFHAFETSSTPVFSDILRTLKPDLVIYDTHQPWAQRVAASLGIPAVLFLTASAECASYGLHNLKENQVAEFPFRIRDRIIVPGALSSEGHRRHSKGARSFLESFDGSCHIVLIKTSREIEGDFVDWMSSSLGKKVIPVGLLVHEYSTDQDDDCYDDSIISCNSSTRSNQQDPPLVILNEARQDTQIIQWLEKKEKASTVFVSFGSEYFLSREEREELAHGLELSNVNFIWVVRFPKGDNNNKKIVIGKIEEELPDGFLERIGERGMVVEGWAPQTRILGHPNTGGFVSHCGWNSIGESLWFGVPIIGMPMLHDQPFNAKLVEELGVGVEAKRYKRENKFKRGEIAEAIRALMVDKIGEDLRRKATELGDVLRRKSEDGEEIDEVVNELHKFTSHKV